MCPSHLQDCYPLSRSSVLRIFVANMVTPSPHYVHVRHCLPSRSSHFLRLYQNIDDTSRSFCRSFENKSEISPQFLPSNSEILLAATSNQVKCLHLQIVVATGFAIHDPVNISVGQILDLSTVGLERSSCTYDSPMNSYVDE